MQFLRFGLVIWVFVRLFGVLRRLRARFSGTSFTVDGKTFEYEVSRHKRRITGVKIGVGAPFKVRFVLRTEGFIDRLGKWLAVAREYQTGDAAFDERVYVLSDDRSLVDTLAFDAQLREHVLAVLSDETVKAIHCNAGVLWVEARAPDGADKDDSDAVVATGLARAIGADLLGMRERLRSLVAGEWTPARDPYVSREAVFYGISVALAVAAIACFFWSYGHGLPRMLVFDQTERLAAGVAFVLWLGGSIAAFMLMGGSSRAHLVLIEILITATPSAWFVARTAFAEYNIHADVTESRSYVAQVTDRHIARGRRGRRSYYLVFDQWPDPRIETRLRVSSTLYARFPEGSCVRVGLRTGRLRDPWLEYLRPDSGCW
jgi:hypothetical protein